MKSGVRTFVVQRLREYAAGERISRRGCGLCENLHYAIEDELGLSYSTAQTWVHAVVQLAPNWKKFSGNHRYPVPAPANESAAAKYHNSAFEMLLWAGPYGDLRKELCGFLADQVESLR